MPSDTQNDRKLIFDIGAHKGEDADFYLKKGFKVVAVEAHPGLVLKLRERFKSNIEDGSLVLIEAAIAEHNGEAEFYMNESVSIWGTIRPDWADRNEAIGAPSRRITVKAVTFVEVLRQYGIPHYLKIDIEGADLLCLESLAALQVKPRFVSIESDKRSWEGLLREFELFKDLGYNGFKIIDQGKIGRQEVPNPALEGLYLSHRFEAGSSGLFGEELPGRWLTMEKALKEYGRIFLRYRLFGDYGVVRGVRFMRRMPLIGKWFEVFWYDTHATTFDDV